MADEYIKREDALTELDEIGFCDDEPIQTRNSALKIIQNIPAADVAPVRHGRWKKSYADHEAFGVRPFFRYCSECHEATVHQYNYCPNCGADMREVQND